MRNELLKIGPFTVYGYGFMIAIGIVAGFLVAEYRAKRKHMDYEQIIWLCSASLAGGFLGAKILFWITEIKMMMTDPMFFLKTMGDGFVVFGGIIGGIVGGYLYAKKKKINFWAYFDLLVPSLALAQGFGRIGCFLAGCCYGKETQSIVHVIFTESWYAPNGVKLIPTQLYSAGLDFIHCIILLIVAEKSKHHGITAAIYLILYSLGRFILEFYRGDISRGYVGVLSTSQFISLFSLALGIVLLVWRSKNVE